MQGLLNKLMTFCWIKLSAWHERKIHEQCSSAVILGDGSRFYKQASVVNLQQDKTKITIGRDTHLRAELIVFPYGGSIQIGDCCYMGEGTKLWSGEKIIIGNHVAIAHNVNIADFAHEADHLERAAGIKRILTHGHPKEKGSIPTAPIIIDDYVAIYPNAIISRGVRIGEGAVISAGSVVLTDVPPFTLMMGNPARPMKKLIPDERITQSTMA
jgi:acetyltransferase-like isoleucine patch superfamily enzyme